jgi:hypothetical protein
MTNETYNPVTNPYRPHNILPDTYNPVPGTYRPHIQYKCPAARSSPALESCTRFPFPSPLLFLSLYQDPHQPLHCTAGPRQGQSQGLGQMKIFQNGLKFNSKKYLFNANHFSQCNTEYSFTDHC